MQGSELENDIRLPVTVVSGFLGAEKTNLPNPMLNNREGMKVAVIVNDMSEVIIDAELVKQDGGHLRTDEKLVEMSNGCIWGTLRDDLLKEVRRLAEAISATPEQRDLARKIIVLLNAEARIVEADYDRVPLGAVLNTGLFDFARVQTHPLWCKELSGFKDHMPKTEEYGIRSFVYRARRPFTPMAFNAFVNTFWPGVIRAKGFFWLATRSNYVGKVVQAGAMVRPSKRGLWWAAVPKTRWPDSADWRESTKPYFDKTFCDRRQEIVFIGPCDQMDEAAICAELDAAPTGTVDRFTPDAWKHLPDPFPHWERHAA